MNEQEWVAKFTASNTEVKSESTESDDQNDVLTPEEEVSEEVVDEVVETTDTAKPEEADTDVSEESEETDEQTEDDSEEELDEDADSFFEIDGERTTVKEFKEMKKSKMLQADYTKKTTEVAKMKDEVSTELEQVKLERVQAQELRTSMKAVLDELSEDVDLEYLKEYDKTEYYEQKEKQDKIKSKIEESLKNEKDIKDKEHNNIVMKNTSEYFERNPQYYNEDKTDVSEVFTKDFKDMSNYLVKEHGLEQSEIDNIIVHNPKYWDIVKVAFTNSVKVKNAVNKETKMKENLKSIPIVTKKGSKAVVAENKELDDARKNYKTKGDEKSYIKLMEVEAKFKNK